MQIILVSFTEVFCIYKRGFNYPNVDGDNVYFHLLLTLWV